MIIQELFYSYQGEGPFVGYPQIFIRFYGCNIACAYCDEPDIKKVVIQEPEVMRRLNEWLTLPLHSISFTGGEPLLQVDAIKRLIAYLDPYQIPYFLETNGMFPDKLKQVADQFTYFSVDYKPGYTDQFKSFLQIANDHGTAYAKLIVLHDQSVDDVIGLASIIQQVNPKIPLILQPVTPYGVVTRVPTFETIQSAYNAATHLGCDVRVIGQTHKLIGIK